MIILFASIIILGIIAALFSIFTKGSTQPVDPEPTCATCSGEDERCEQECMMEAALKDIEYYDDEELDNYANRPSDSYTDEEVEEFAEIMYTLKPEDVKGWNRSLILRNINIPNQLKDELITMLSMLVVVITFATGLTSCSTQKNNAQSRWWHSFNARYNTYYNGAQAYIDASLEKEKGNKDNFTEILPLYTVGNKQSKELGKSNYETAILKSQKAIKQHSIKKRPEWTKNRKKTEKDIEWLNRREYNPFIWKAWMLMGRSQFHKGAFDEAAATFSYMSRLFRTQPAIYGKARAWLAKSYIEQDWMYDAEDVIRNMQRDSIDWHAQKEWDYTMADYYVHTADWTNAEKYLRKVIKHERRATQRAREWFLLGQVQKELGKNADSYRSFKKVIKQNPPYELEFNARIAMTEVMTTGHNKQKTSKLKAMARSDNNKDYLDQVYYAMGNIYLNDKDTTMAIWAYEKGNEKATRSGIEKGVLLLHLGDLYWQKEKFSDAKRCYGEAIGLLDKDRKDYQQLSNRSKVLDELVPHTESIHLQDSLQALAKMSEKDRNAAIDRVIEQLKKKEKEEKRKEQEAQAQQAQQRNGGNNMQRDNMPAQRNQQQNGTWYFYNPMAVQQGKQTFKQQWGNRENTDDWQRINRTIVNNGSNNDGEDVALDEDGNPINANDSTDVADADAKDKKKEDDPAQDPHKREYYMAQIPFEEEQLQASNAALSDGLFHAGVIFKDKLDNFTLAEKSLIRLTTDFSEYEKNDEAYYHLFLLYSRMGDTQKAEYYRTKMSTDYATSTWTTIITDPYFEENALYGTHREDSLYANTYDAFVTDDYSLVGRNTRMSEQRYPLGQHRDKFIFINGLSRLNQGDADSCVTSMERIIQEYPQSEVASIAGMIINGVKAGKRLHGAKFDINNLWDKRAESNAAGADSTRQFSNEKIADYLFVMTYDPDSLNTANINSKNINITAENQLLYELAKYNFTNYLVRNFDIEIEDFEGLHRLKVGGFRSYDEALVYTRQLYKNQAITQLAAKSRNIIISQANLDMLGKEFSYNDYDDFYQKNFAPLPVAQPYLLNEQILKPESYDPEYQPAAKKDSESEENNDEEDNVNITTIDIPETIMEVPEETTVIEDKQNEIIETAPTIIEDAPATIETGNATIIEDTPVATETETTTIIEDTSVAVETDTNTIIEDTPDTVIEENTGINIEENTTTTVRQEIFNEVIEIIDEESNNNNTPSTINNQQNDDEYFDFDGF